MQNRWNEAEAAGMDELDQLVYQSRLLGADTSLVLWGGGNTSIKTAEIDFRGAETYVLRVKGSGSDMKSITRQGFAGVRMVDILPLEEREDMTDEDMVEYLSHTLMDPAAPRPSIASTCWTVCRTSRQRRRPGSPRDGAGPRRLPRADP